MVAAALGSPVHTLRLLIAALLVALAVPVTAGAASNWQLTQLPAKSLDGGSNQVVLNGVSCPTDSLCVAVGALDTIATSTSPTGGRAAWQVAYPTAPVEPGTNCSEGEGGPAVSCGNYLAGAFQDVSCASESLCVAVGFEGSAVVSRDPTGGASAWHLANVNKGGGAATHFNSVSCPSTTLCVAAAVDRHGATPWEGRILTTTDPLAGEWQTTQLSGSLELTGISCSGPTLCVAVARGGKIVTSTNPTGGASAWQVIGAPSGAGDLEGIDCITGLCAAGNATGNILTSPDPTRTPWSEAKAGIAALVTGVSCPTASACLGVDNNGSVFTSTDPTGGSAAWHAENLVPFEASPGEAQFVHNALFGASCASTSLCALVGSDSRIFTSTSPFGAAGSPGGPGTGKDPRAHHAPRRPKTFLVFAENFWPTAFTHRHRHRVRARFHFYSPTRTRGFECKRDRGRWRRCRSPLRYWVGIGHHTLRVRAIGPTGLRGKPAIRRFRIERGTAPRRSGRSAAGRR
jgi:hypothetical protein